MAVSNLRCTREGDSIAVTWAWDINQTSAHITVTRLLDGKEVVCRDVDQFLYQQAINSPRHGPTLKVPPVPLRVSVKDSDNEETFDLSDMLYHVEWRLKKQNVYAKKGLFGRKLVRTDISLQLRFPYESQVPNDLFCYVLTAPGSKPQKGDPIGYLPVLRPGINEYGVIASSGQAIQLCCNPSIHGITRLFDFKRQPDVEE